MEAVEVMRSCQIHGLSQQDLLLGEDSDVWS